MSLKFLLLRAVFVLTTALPALSLAAAPASAPQSELVRISGEWKEDKDDPLSWFVIGTPSSTPRVTVQNAKFETESENAGTLNDLPATERDRLAESIQKQVSVQPMGILRYWQIYKISMQTPTVSAEKPYRLTYIDLDVEISPKDVEPSTHKVSLPAKPWGFASVIHELVSNPEDAERLADAGLSVAEGLEDVDWTPDDLPDGNLVFKTLIGRDGFVRILPEHFAQLKVSPATINPSSINVLSRGVPVATFRVDDGDGEFEEGESILFYARRSDSSFSLDRAYWIAVDPANTNTPVPLNGPLPQVSEDALLLPWYMAEYRAEEDEFDKYEEGNFLEIREVRWVWKAMTGDEATTVTFSLPNMAALDELSPETVPLTLNFFHLSETSANLPPNSLPISKRQVRVDVNGVDLGVHVFADSRDMIKTLSVPLGILVPEDNLLTLRLSAIDGQTLEGDLSAGTYFDNLTLQYPAIPRVGAESILRINMAENSASAPMGFELERISDGHFAAIDITDPDRPEKIQLSEIKGDLSLVTPQGAAGIFEVLDVDSCTSAPLMRQWAPSTIRDRDNESDYLIITHSSFRDILKPLVDQKTAEGFAVKVVDAEDIYNEFSHGELTPVAVKSFLLYTLRHWKTQPTYVLLVGDCTGDYLNQLRNDVQNLVPGYRTPSTDQDTWTSDHWFSTLIGNDELPDVILGRLSIVSEEDAVEVVRKQVQASRQLPFGPWRNRFLFVADNEPGFSDACEELLDGQIPNGFFVRRIYLEQMPWERNFYLDKGDVDAENLKVSGKTTQAILDALNAGQSHLLYCGHGAPNIWTDERIWFGMDSKNSDNLLLRNSDRMPFAINLTCNTGAIDYPKPPYNISITEDMMRVKQGGLRSQYVPSGPGSTTDHLIFARDIYPPLLSGNMRNQGDAILLGKARYILNGMNDLNYPKMFILLGDPALPLTLPKSTLKISASPSSIDLREKRKTIAVSLDEIQFGSGQIVFQFGAPDREKRNLPETKAMVFSERQRSFAIELPSDLKPGKWRLSAYAWNDELKEDAHGYVELVVGQPYAEIADFRVIPKKKGKETKIDLLLKNPSLLPVKALQFDVLLKSGSQFSRIGGDSIDLDAGEEQTWSMDWNAEAGRLYELRAALKNYLATPVTQASTPTQRDLAWALPNPDGEIGFAISETDLQRHIRQVDPEVDAEIRLPVHRLSGNYAGPLEIGYGWGGTVTTTDTLTVASGQPKGEFVFHLTAAASELPRPFTVQLDPQKKLLKAEGAARLDPTLDIKSLPDLQFVRDGLIVDPPDPADAHTIWFKVTVRNAGGSDATAFRVSAYDDDPTSGGVELVSAVFDDANNIAGLAAGAQTQAVIRWDPKENAGTQKIYFKIDSMNQVLESNEKNNVGTKTLQVRTLAQLEPVSFEFDLSELLRFRKVRARAAVRNSGETEARNVIVSFFSDREGDQANHMGDKFIEVIRPGETRVETYEWDLPPNFREKVKEALERNLPAESIRIDGCAQIYLRGSLQRVLMAPHSATRVD